jgi:hypothetical protein
MTTADSGARAPVQQHGTHHKLVSPTEQRKLYPKLTLDAIVVPAARPAWNLEQAITLARAAHCTLLILCSHEATPDGVQEFLNERSFDQATVVDLPDSYGHELLSFRGLESIGDDLPEACGYYTTNLSTKRNLGLLLARMTGWERIFFLDDDIRDIGHPDMQSTVSMLARYRSAGMRVKTFPDNSAACHAHRETGGYQDVFLSGAALAVDMQHEVSFFANVYNEDWLFMYDDVVNGHIGSSARLITQLRYNPFGDPRRAAWQEFGDVLAEGLYAQLDCGLDLTGATRDYWRDFLRARHKFLAAIIRRAGTRTEEVLTEERRTQLLGSVEAALDCSRTIKPQVLERYIMLWLQDREEWQQRLATVGQRYPLAVALKELGLEPSHHGWAADVTRLPRKAVSERRPGPQERGAGRALGTLRDYRGSSIGWRSGLAAAGRRGFWKSGRACGQQAPSSAPEAKV